MIENQKYIKFKIMKKSYFNFIKNDFKIIIFITLFSSGVLTNNALYAQTLSATDGGIICGTCAPPGWVIDAGTPDVSNATQASVPVPGISGGGSSWNVPSGVLPLPPNGHTTWISLRDLGPSGSEEVVSTTMTGLVIGSLYEVTLYTLTATANADGQGWS